MPTNSNAFGRVRRAGAAAGGAGLVWATAWVAETFWLHPCRYHAQESWVARLLYDFSSADGFHPTRSPIYHGLFLGLGAVLGGTRAHTVKALRWRQSHTHFTKREAAMVSSAVTKGAS